MHFLATVDEHGWKTSTCLLCLNNFGVQGTYSFFQVEKAVLKTLIAERIILVVTPSELEWMVDYYQYSHAVNVLE